MRSYTTGGSFEWSAECDVCRKKTKASKLKKRWDGLMVCHEDFEARHPLDFYTTKNDVHLLPFTRPPEGRTPTPEFSTITSTSSDGTNTVTSTHVITGSPTAHWQANVGPDLTIMAWVMPKDNATRQCIFSTRSAESVGSWSFDICGDSTNQQPNMGLMFANVDVGILSSWVSWDNALKLGVWQHVCYTREDATQRQSFYVNGVYVGGVLPIGHAYESIVGVADDLYLARATATTNPMIGGLRDVRIWNACLTENEVKVNMQTPASTRRLTTTDSANLLAWYKCDSGTSAFDDSSGNSNDLTATTATDITWTQGSFVHGSV